VSTRTQQHVVPAVKDAAGKAGQTVDRAWQQGSQRVGGAARRAAEIWEQNRPRTGPGAGAAA